MRLQDADMTKMCSTAAQLKRHILVEETVKPFSHKDSSPYTFLDILGKDFEQERQCTSHHNQEPSKLHQSTSTYVSSESHYGGLLESLDNGPFLSLFLKPLDQEGSSMAHDVVESTLSMSRYGGSGSLVDPSNKQVPQSGTRNTTAATIENQRVLSSLYDPRVVIRDCKPFGSYKTYNCSHREQLDETYAMQNSFLLDEPHNSFTSCSDSFETDYSQNSKNSINGSTQLRSDMSSMFQHKPDDVCAYEDPKRTFLNVPCTTTRIGESAKLRMSSSPSFPPGTPTYSISSEDTSRLHDTSGRFQVSPSYDSALNHHPPYDMMKIRNMRDQEDKSETRSSLGSGQNTNSIQDTDWGSISKYSLPLSTDVGKDRSCSDDDTSSHLRVSCDNDKYTSTQSNVCLALPNYGVCRRDSIQSTSTHNSKAHLWCGEIPAMISKDDVPVDKRGTLNAALNISNLKTYGAMESKVGQLKSTVNSTEQTSENAESGQASETSLFFQVFRSLTEFTSLAFASKRWQNLNVVLPLFIPHGVIAIVRSTGENTYVFSDKYSASQLLFSGAGRICDMWSSYLRLRVAVIHKCPEFLIPRVVEVFNKQLTSLPKFSSPIHLICSGIVKHTIQLRSFEGLTYRYDTIGRFRDVEDKKKMRIVFDGLQRVLHEVNTKLTQEAAEIMRMFQAQEGCKLDQRQAAQRGAQAHIEMNELNDLRASVFESNPRERNDNNSMNGYSQGYSHPDPPGSFSQTNATARPRCGLEFRFSPCKELKIPIREGSLCECAGVDSLIAGGGAASMSCWAQQFSVDNLILGEIRLERDKTSETQLDPFFLPQHELRTRMIAKDANKEPARVCFVDPAVYPTLYRPNVEYALNATPFDAAKRLCGATHHALASLLPEGLSSIVPGLSYGHSLFQSNYVDRKLSGTSQPAYNRIREPGYITDESHGQDSPGSNGYSSTSHPFAVNHNSGTGYGIPSKSNLSPHNTMSLNYPLDNPVSLTHEKVISNGSVNALPSRCMPTEDCELNGGVLRPAVDRATDAGNDLVTIQKMFSDVTTSGCLERESAPRIFGTASSPQNDQQHHPMNILNYYEESKDLSLESRERLLQSQAATNVFSFPATYVMKKEIAALPWLTTEAEAPQESQAFKVKPNAMIHDLRFGTYSGMGIKDKEKTKDNLFLQYVEDLTPSMESQDYSARRLNRVPQESHVFPPSLNMYYRKNSPRSAKGDVRDVEQDKSDKTRTHRVILENVVENPTVSGYDVQGVLTRRISKSAGGTPAHENTVLRMPDFDLTDSISRESGGRSSFKPFDRYRPTKDERNERLDQGKEATLTSATTTGGDSLPSDSVSVMCPMSVPLGRPPAP